MIYDVLKTFDIPKLDKRMCFAGIDYSTVHTMAQSIDIDNPE